MSKYGFLIVLGLIGILAPPFIHADTLLYDDFSGNRVSSDKWHIPTWVSPADGTVVGLTQFRFTQNSSLPAANNGCAIIALESYNPTAISFYGTDLRSNQSFAVGSGIHITVRAKMDTATRGIVGGIFLYALKPGSTTNHDEIDFEFITNRPHGVQTNIYGNEKLGDGHVVFVPYASGSIMDYHTYEIKWLPEQVSWFIDGKLVRTDTNHVPAGPMNLHLNIWVPGSGWPAAYDPDLKPATSADSNRIFSMSVDSVHVQSMTPAQAGGLPLQIGGVRSGTDYER
ncbi:glycoside hydrolase family 16 protein [Desulfatirhabdium butyrativorans]|uniref:glycoside hydrolase family 16 protein n=1 Tax=Desulfatirhabdium butyrativorans TaxID=340467 RepID=UPI0003FE3FF2|nr:glycoside hydrolase family 16 protein [Desulfatirhabdium butyrativorans]